MRAKVVGTTSVVVLTIGYAYMRRDDRERNRGDNSIVKWIKAYCKRNHIPTEDVWDPKLESTYLHLNFRSCHQMDCFVRRGSHNYPFFEFL